jgi:hypothetical protein
VTFKEPLIQVAYPPIIDELEKVFGALKGKPILYAFGDVIYNPANVHMFPQLLAHEYTHAMRQQAGSLDEWWKNYMENVEYRLNEEVLAHRAEYGAFKQLHKDRNLRARYLQKVSMKLASPLYGRMVPANEAKRLIEELQK